MPFVRYPVTKDLRVDFNLIFSNIYMYRKAIVICLLLSAGSLWSCSTSSIIEEETAREAAIAGEVPQTVDDLYQIGPGDEIEILVWEQPGFNTTGTVSSTGTIVIPLIGEMNVNGLTQSQFERELKEELSEYIRGEIILTISIRNTAHMIVSVLGMVARSDNYPIVDETPIYKVLSMAGGPSEEADIRKIKIYRKTRTPHTQTLDLTQYLDSGMDNPQAMVRPGDVVYVPQKENAVREMSDFLRDIALLFGIFRVLN